MTDTSTTRAAVEAALEESPYQPGFYRLAEAIMLREAHAERERRARAIIAGR